MVSQAGYRHFLDSCLLHALYLSLGVAVSLPRKRRIVNRLRRWDLTRALMSGLLRLEAALLPRGLVGTSLMHEIAIRRGFPSAATRGRP